jgi:hypothetical protein
MSIVPDASGATVRAVSAQMRSAVALSQQCGTPVADPQLILEWADALDAALVGALCATCGHAEAGHHHVMTDGQWCGVDGCLCVGCPSCDGAGRVLPAPPQESKP